MSDVVERLRAVGCDREPFTPEHADCICRLSNAAADEIERLRYEIETIRLDVAHVVTMCEDSLQAASA